MGELWVREVNSEGHPVTVTSRPASPAEIAAAAANLDGAERAWWCETHQQSVPPCGARMNCSTVGILVIPLPDKETP